MPSPTSCGADPLVRVDNGKCYDLEIRMADLASTAFDPETYKKMEFKDYGRIETQFRRVLSSFHFLK